MRGAQLEGQLAFDFDAALASVPNEVERRVELSPADMETMSNAVRVAAATTCARYGLAFTEDVTQQGWLEALKAYPRFDPTRGVKLGAYLCGVVRLRLVDWLRVGSPLTRPQIAENQRARREGREVPWRPMVSYDEPGLDGSSTASHLSTLADESVDDAFEAVEDRVMASRMIREARELFEPGSRAAFLFEHVVLGGMTQVDAAQILDMTASRVSQVMVREVIPALRERFADVAAA